ncbi:hypothetical protein ACFL0Q_05635, partial [Thermodesulfobacteriota bacterium]
SSGQEFCKRLRGIAELLGEMLTAWLGDRAGLKRCVMAGVVVSAAAYVLVPVLGGSFMPALVGLFVVFLSFEFTVVSFLSLCTELLPSSRATMMAGFFATTALGRIVGALLGGPLWLAGGIWATGGVCAGTSLLALASMMWGLRGWNHEQ